MGRQVREVMNGLDVLVATPGRLLDLLRSNGVRLNQVEVLVLDEADRMLDMGFIHDIRTIVAKLPKERQTLLFSATMPREISDLATQMLRDPVRVAVTPVASTVERVAQRVIMVDKPAKSALLVETLRAECTGQTLVFTRTKHGADKVVKQPASRRPVGRGDPRQQVAEPARARARCVPRRKAQDAGRDRHRGARHRRGGHQPRHQFRPAEHSGELRAPHRPHRARRRGRHRDLVLRQRGDAVPARHREADPDEAAGDRTAQRAARRGGAASSAAECQRPERQSPQRPAATAQWRRQRHTVSSTQRAWSSGPAQRRNEQGQQQSRQENRPTAHRPPQARRTTSRRSPSCGNRNRAASGDASRHTR